VTPESTRDKIPVGSSVRVESVSPTDSDEVWVKKNGYLQQDTVELASAQDPVGSARIIDTAPAMFDTAGLVAEQFEATSLDGTQIPYFLVRRKDIPLDGSTPTVLNGYGGFQISQLPEYMPDWGAAWLEKGGALAVANIRGGGEFGPAWHKAALQEKRHKAYEDFEAVARDLISRGVTSPERLACQGDSNGGLLVGNMVTREGARLFGAAVCMVPLLDMRRYAKLLAGASWMAEYGNPDDPEQWKFIRTFSPYQRVEDVCLKPGSGWKCPKVLFTTSTKDDRVHPGHARKMVKRLHDEVPAQQAPMVVYWENTEGGHGGTADNKQKSYMGSLIFTFLWNTIGAEGGQK